MNKLYIPTILVLIIFLNGRYRGSPSEKPPLHIIPDMDSQAKYKQQVEGAFFKDSAAPEGTVAQSDLKENKEFYFGKDRDGNFIKRIPVTVTKEFLNQGMERFNIYCSACHSRIGDGNGIVAQKGYPQPPSFHVDSVRTKPDGYIYDVITSGKGYMPSYSYQVQVKARWAITGYLRVLKQSQNARLKDLPPEKREKFK